MDRPVRWYDYITININWFALTARSQTLTPLIIPLLVQQFVGEAAKGAYVGTIRLWALMFAVLAQAFFGMLSDRSTLRWGRRRPFILIGTIGELVVFAFIALITGMQGMAGYWVLFALYFLSMLTSNTAHAATQGLIPDLVPEEKRGLFSGFKTLMELPLPLIFVSLLIGKLVAGGNMGGALLALSVSMLIAMGISMFVPEKPLEEVPPMDWYFLLRLLGLTAAFTLVILSTGEAVQWITGLAQDVPQSTALILIAVAGLVGMGVAVAIGVWLSLRIGIGKGWRGNSSFIWWVVCRLSYLVALNNLATFLVFFLQERFSELSTEQAADPAANVMMFVGVFILLTALPAGWLGDRIDKRILIAISGLLASIGTFVVVLTPGMDMLRVGACVIGAGGGLFYSVSWALGTEIVPREKAGQFLGLQNLAGAGAGAIGSYIGGPIADNTSYVLLMTIYGLVFLLSILPLLGIREGVAL